MLSVVLAIAVGPKPAPDAAVTRVFEEHCNACHGPGAELVLQDVPLGSLVGRPGQDGTPLVAPGDPEGSYLYRKLIGDAGVRGSVMPLGAEPLTPADLATVRAWIETVKAPGGSYEPPPPTPQKPFRGTHQINLQTTTTLGKRTIGYRIHHRFGRFGVPVRDRNGFGLASGGVVMSMGIEYGIIDGLDAMIRWTNSSLGWELGMKYVPVRQEDGMPLSFGMFASFEALGERRSAASNRFTGNAQAMLSRLWFRRWSTQLTVGYSALTNHTPGVPGRGGEAPIIVLDRDGQAVEFRDRRGTFNLGFASTVWLGKKRNHGIDFEYAFPIPDGADPNAFFYNGGDANPDGTKIGSWALGWSARTGLHLFQVFVTNTRNIHTNLAAPGGDTKNPFSPFGDFFLGFNISRKWQL